ncbi:hypothetical protein KEF29_16680 [Streptomyces tuirus]|uniref:Uncharacterized protein n=1 Tax=Streptomyces tuirus TaxID=68278 RepID=A0A941FF04_9ACTN|nr:hypothetical protein [Streptomyces tuirus]
MPDDVFQGNFTRGDFQWVFIHVVHDGCCLAGGFFPRGATGEQWFISAELVQLLSGAVELFGVPIGDGQAPADPEDIVVVDCGADFSFAVAGQYLLQEDSNVIPAFSVLVEGGQVQRMSRGFLSEWITRFQKLKGILEISCAFLQAIVCQMAHADEASAAALIEWFGMRLVSMVGEGESVVLPVENPIAEGKHEGHVMGERMVTVSSQLFVQFLKTKQGFLVLPFVDQRQSPLEAFRSPVPSGAVAVTECHGCLLVSRP